MIWRVPEVTKVRFDHRGCLEAVVASEAIKRYHISNMHMDK